MNDVGIGYTLATGRLFCDFARFHEYAEELLGRPLMTDDFASEYTWHELRTVFASRATEREDQTPHQEKG